MAVHALRCGKVADVPKCWNNLKHSNVIRIQPSITKWLPHKLVFELLPQLFLLWRLLTARYVDINVVLMVDFPIIKQLNTPHSQFQVSQLNTNKFVTNSWMVSSALTVSSISNAYCNQLSAWPCTGDGAFLNISDPQMPPPTPVDPSKNPWGPFQDRLDFDWAHYHFVWLQSSKSEILEGLDLWCATVIKHSLEHPTQEGVPWHNVDDLYRTIDCI